MARCVWHRSALAIHLDARNLHSHYQTEKTLLRRNPEPWSDNSTDHLDRGSRGNSELTLLANTAPVGDAVFYFTLQIQMGGLFFVAVQSSALRPFHTTARPVRTASTTTTAAAAE